MFNITQTIWDIVNGHSYKILICMKSIKTYLQNFPPYSSNPRSLLLKIQISWSLPFHICLSGTSMNNWITNLMLAWWQFLLYLLHWHNLNNQIHRLHLSPKPFETQVSDIGPHDPIVSIIMHINSLKIFFSDFLFICSLILLSLHRSQCYFFCQRFLRNYKS